MNTQNTAELTAPENSSLEASIHAPASGSVSSHSPADPSSTTRAPSIVDKLTLNEARCNTAGFTESLPDGELL
ncbi:uncharacterized protein OCT59_007098 [Rhizophagus irregularis]|uniref:uncharacterized protein n=1 Tax=Rhizophagus irregularis TaxID=588596 RepID=UPI001C1A9A00|nr:hypothetical protein OCT59_007098 [Rhizophagus irregularis]CAB4477925.1 unnamed protein product [Rhizophagus irregularis]